MSYRDFLREKKKGLTDSTYFFHGSDPYFLKEAERAIKEGIASEQRDFGLDVYDLDPASDDTSSFKDIIASLNTFSFFSEKKSVIVQNVQKLKKNEEEGLREYISRPSDSSTLFLFFHGTLKANKKSVFAGCTIISLDLQHHELKNWIKEYGKEKGITISNQLTDFLLAILGNDAGLLASEVNKLSLLRKENFDISDLENILYGEAGVNTFQITRAITSNNKKRAFSLLKGLKDTDSSLFLGALNWQIANAKPPLTPERKQYFYKILLEADTLNKSTGSSYPLELLVSKLLDRKGLY